MQETTTPDGIEGNYQTTSDSDGPVTVNIQVTQQDRELQAIEATLVILQMLPYDTRVRALTYIRSRVESDPAVWGGGHPEPPTVTPVLHTDIARIIAEADGYTWADLHPTAQLPYYTRAKALTSAGINMMWEN